MCVNISITIFMCSMRQGGKIQKGVLDKGTKFIRSAVSLISLCVYLIIL